MILFKAINYDGHSEKVFTSEFHRFYKTAKDDKNDMTASCFEDIIKTGFTHITNGDTKKEKDYWISTTSDYEKAIKYLNNDKYNFNGIAIINLPNTKQTGFIYDNNLRERGYIDKDFSRNQLSNIWKTNEDGIAITLDLSSPYTINYLASYLWLKGNSSALNSFRPFAYANASSEILIMGEKIKFEFIPKEDVEEYKSRYLNNQVYDYYLNLFIKFIKYAPDSKIKEELFRNAGKMYISEEDEYLSYLIDYISFVVDFPVSGIDMNDPYVRMEVMQDYYINEDEIRKMFNQQKEEERVKALKPFYQNTTYHYDRKKARERFYNLETECEKWTYEDKDIIDFLKYEITSANDTITYEDYLYAYIYSIIYLQIKLQNKLTEKTNLWYILNQFYNYKFVKKNAEIKNKDFLEYYKKSLGISNKDLKKQISYSYYNLYRDLYLDLGF